MSQSQYSGIHMLMPSKYLMLILSLVCVSLNIANAGEVVRITPAQIKTLGIETSPIQANANANSQRLPGEIVVPVDQARIISAPQSGLIDELSAWRARRAQSMFQHPDEICSQDDLRTLAESLPSSTDELATIFGPLTAATVSREILAIIDAHRSTAAAS